MQFFWHQNALLCGWVFVVNGQPEGFGVSPQQSYDDARQRFREEYECEPAPEDSLTHWLKPLEGGQVVMLSASSLQQLANALLGWVDPSPQARPSWVASLEQYKVHLTRSNRYRLALSNSTSE